MDDTLDSVGNIESNVADLVTKKSDLNKKIKNKDEPNSNKSKNKFA